MAYEEEQRQESRVVVETPSSKREVSRSEAVRYPEGDGASGLALAAVVVGIVALAAIIILFVMNRQAQETANANTAQPPQTTIVQQPAQQQPPVVIQQPAPATQPAPIIVNQPGGGSTGGSATDDSAIQAAIDKRLSNDPNLSSLGVFVTFANGKATITGTVKTESQKAQVGRAVLNVKGVKTVDNQIIVG